MAADPDLAAREGTLLSLPGRFHEPFNDVGAEEVVASLADWLG